MSIDIKRNVMGLMLTAPDRHVFRFQLVYNYIKTDRYNEATEILVMIATDCIGDELSKQCLQLAEWCFSKCEEKTPQPKKILIAALLSMTGQREGRDIIDINAAVHLANVHLDRGHSSARALFEGQQLLMSQSKNFTAEHSHG